MSAYIIAYVDVTDTKQYEDYKKLSSHAIQVHGAKICVRGGAVDVLEGEWSPQRVVVLQFEDMAAAKTFYNSPEYAQARQARAGAAHMRMIVVDGF
ncbi:MAG: DUF1330 domain-containing protein [Saezia sp.]